VSRPVSIVIPTLADRELLRRCLEALAVELGARDCGDEVLVVEDSGLGELEEWLSVEFPLVRFLSHEANQGFAAALSTGVTAARHEELLALNPDVRVRPGLLDPLLETLALPGVRAVSPLVLQGDGELGEESLPRLEFERGLPLVVRAELDVTPGEPCVEHPEGVPVAYCLGGAFLFRREEFLASPFDARYEPFYWEDVDWCQDAVRQGDRVLVDPRAVVEHHSRGTIGCRVPEHLRRAAIEKNRLLFAWKHLEADVDRRELLEELGARLVEHSLCEEREELLWLLLMLEQEQEARAEALRVPPR
jgi:GT2 family glycosyltransferase